VLVSVRFDPRSENLTLFCPFWFRAFQGSAAACRGGNSSQTSDKVAIILVQLACEGKSLIPSDKARDPAELSFLSSDLAANDAIEAATASAYGSMLYAEAYPLMKQRLTHVALKIIRAAYEEEHARAERGQTRNHGFPRIGLLVIASHIVCSSDISKLDKKTLHQLSVITLEGLSSRVFPVDESSTLKFAAVRKLVLSSILKLICVAPTSVRIFFVSVPFYTFPFWFTKIYASILITDFSKVCCRERLVTCLFEYAPCFRSK
jgi:hypothetical protein